jgi:hypothetical protein
VTAIKRRQAAEPTATCMVGIIACSLVLARETFDGMYFCAVLKLQYGTVSTADAVGGIQFTVDNVHPRGC